MLVPTQIAIASGISRAISSVKSPLVFKRRCQGAFDLVDDLSANVGQELENSVSYLVVGRKKQVILP